MFQRERGHVQGKKKACHRRVMWEFLREGSIFLRELSEFLRENFLTDQLKSCSQRMAWGGGGELFLREIRDLFKS